MNYRVTLGFLAAAVVLAVLVVGLDKFNIGPTQPPTGQRHVHDDGRSDAPDLSVRRLEGHRLRAASGRPVGAIDKQGDAWVVAGTGDPANRSSFTSLIVRMSQLKATRAGR